MISKFLKWLNGINFIFTSLGIGIITIIISFIFKAEDPVANGGLAIIISFAIVALYVLGRQIYWKITKTGDYSK